MKKGDDPRGVFVKPIQEAKAIQNDLGILADYIAADGIGGDFPVGDIGGHLPYTDGCDTAEKGYGQQ
jgi:hypothetical protein